MIHRFSTLLRTFGAIVGVLACASPLLAQDADILGSWDVTVAAGPGPVRTPQQEAATDVSGTWSFQVEIGGVTGTPTMTFKQDGEKLTGHYSGQLGEAPITGTVKGKSIEFAFDATLEGNALHVVYSGTVEKDSMKGKLSIGDLAEGTFTAKKKQ